MIFNFIFFLSVFLLIGIASIFSSRNTKQDYYLASKSVAPSLADLIVLSPHLFGCLKRVRKMQGDQLADVAV